MAIETVAASLVSEVTRRTLEKARYTQKRANIPNDSKAIIDSLPTIQYVAAEIGIDIDAAEYTLTVSKAEDGKVYIYQPAVKSDKGVASLVWGKVSLPLSEVKVPYSIQEVGDKVKKAVMRFELSELEINFSIMLPKDSTETPASLRRAMRAGMLAPCLAATFEKPQSLSELEPGEYLVIGYRENVYNGDLKFNIEVEGMGWFKANSAVHRHLIHEPRISKEEPAKMIVGEVTETTSTGFPIVPVEFYTADYDDIEVFEF